jgi:hypothetical protein
LLIIKEPVEVKEESADAVRVVTVAAAGVVAPTVPLILIEAVPVRLVTVPDAGVPRTAPVASVATPATFNFFAM